MKIKIEIELDTVTDEEKLRDLVRTLGTEIFAASSDATETSDSESQFLAEETPPLKQYHPKSSSPRVKKSGTRVTRGKGKAKANQDSMEFILVTEAQHTAKIAKKTFTEAQRRDNAKIESRTAETTKDWRHWSQ